MKIEVSVIMPALNEEKNIVIAINNVIKSISKTVGDYEIIVIDDGSTDNTREIAEKMARKNKKIIVLHNNRNQGFGFSFKKGIAIAKKNYLTLFPSDNEISEISFRNLVSNAKKTDLIISYNSTSWHRPFFRRLLSRSYVLFMNKVFNLKLRYYTGPFICKSSLIRKLTLRSGGTAILAEIAVKLIKSGYLFLEVPFIYRKRKFGKSTAGSFKNIYFVLNNFIILIDDVILKPRTKTI